MNPFKQKYPQGDNKSMMVKNPFGDSTFENYETAQKFTSQVSASSNTVTKSGFALFSSNKLSNPDSNYTPPSNFTPQSPQNTSRDKASRHQIEIQEKKSAMSRSLLINLKQNKSNRITQNLSAYGRGSKHKTNTNSSNDQIHSAGVKGQRDTMSHLSMQANHLRFYQQVKRYQILMFILCHLTNWIVLFGLPVQFVTGTFFQWYGGFDPYNQENPPAEDSNALSFSAIQVILITCALVYIMIGFTIEYIRRPLIMINGILIFASAMKLGGGLYDMIVEQDNQQFTFDKVDIIHWVVACRFAISMMLIITLAKWFNRTYLPLVLGLFFTSEYSAFKCGELLQYHQNTVLIISGAVGIVFSIVLYYLFNFDPLDCDLLLNEQAVNLTSRYTQNVTDVLLMEDFVEQCQLLRDWQYQDAQLKRTNTTIDVIHQWDDEKEKILQRWKIPNLMSAFKFPGFFRICLCTIVLFLKFRITNFKIAANSHDNDTDHKHFDVKYLYDSFLLGSEFYQIFFGICIIKFSKGRRIFAQYLMLVVLLAIEVSQVVSFDYINSHKGNAIASNTTYFFAALEGQLVYTLFYTLCMLGPIDMAKIETLQFNRKRTGLFLGLMCGTQCFLQALVFDSMIYKFIDDNVFHKNLQYSLVKMIEAILTLIACGLLYPDLTTEIREIKQFSNQEKFNQGTNSLPRRFSYGSDETATQD